MSRKTLKEMPRRNFRRTKRIKYGGPFAISPAVEREVNAETQCESNHIEPSALYVCLDARARPRLSLFCTFVASLMLRDPMHL